jgi:predicted DNA-binding protein (MmcQ/YjbR family)
MPPKKKTSTDSIVAELRKFGLGYPGAHLKSPWPGHKDLAVKDKTFAYLSIEGEPFGISCKLPQSSAAALMLRFTKPTGYGLGKSGWVSASFDDGAAIPVDMLKEWIDESYRAQAPKSLVKELGGSAKAAKPPRDSAVEDPRVPKLLRALKAKPEFAATVREFEERSKGSGRGRKFGSNGLKANGKLFALFTQGTLVVKLPRARVAELIASKAGTAFDPGHGRLMKEWLTVTSPKASWLALVREAYAFVKP